MPTFRMSLSGLCTFSFDKPLKGDGALPTEVTVLMQRLTRARLLSGLPGAKPQILDQHFPLLELNLADLDPASTRLPDVHFCPDASGKMTRGMCLLVGEDLTFMLDDRAMHENALVLSRDAPDDPTATFLSSQTIQDSLFWMVTLEDAFPGNSALKPEILGNPPGSNQPILARARLTEGRLRTAELTDSPCVIVPPTSKSFNQRVATAFEFAVDFGNTVKIKMAANRNGKTSESELILRPATRGDVQISLMNIEINRFIGLDPASGPTAEADFQVYAELLQNPPDPKKIPFLRLTAPGDPAGSGGMSTCVPHG